MTTGDPLKRVDPVTGYRPRENRCPNNGKQQHASKEAALRHRAQLMRVKGKANGRTNVYRCDWCKTWHVGRR